MNEQDYFIGSTWQGEIVVKDYDHETGTVTGEPLVVDSSKINREGL